MPNTEIELKPVDFITIGTIGPKGQRVFYLQAGKDNRLVSFVIEKEQAWALSEAINEFVDELDERLNTETVGDVSSVDMDLREPIEPVFRIAQMGLAYDEDEELVILVAQELVAGDDDEDDEVAGVARMYCTTLQMRTLSTQAMDTVESGRPDPKQNGRIIYYWT